MSRPVLALALLALSTPIHAGVVGQASESIGLLRFLDAHPTGQADDPWCSASVIGPDLLLTAGSCLGRAPAADHGYALAADLNTADELCAELYVEVGYGRRQFKCAEVVELIDWGGLDVAVLRVGSTVSAGGSELGMLQGPGALNLASTAPVSGEALAIGYQDSGSSVRSAAATVSTLDKGFFHHDAALGASSWGGPVFDKFGQVVGLSLGPSGEATTLATAVPFLGSLALTQERWVGQSLVLDRLSSGDKAIVGDFDGDGYDDLAQGHHHYAGVPWMYGVLRLRYGGLDGLDASSETHVLQVGGTSPEDGDYFGDTLAAGDFDGDGYDDLAVGTPYENWGNTQHTGIVHAYYGGPGGIDQDTAAANHDRFHPMGLGLADPADTRYGWVLATGDFDGDGYDDLVTTSRDQVHVYYGAIGGLSVARLEVLRPLDPATADEDAQVVQAEVGDVDGDGYDDLIINVSDSPYPRVFVLPGSKIGLATDTASELDPGMYDSVQLSMYKSIQVGDVDGDGRDDVLVASWVRPGDGTEGALYLAFGGATTALVIDEEWLAADLGVARILGLGSLGVAELEAGAPGVFQLVTDEGRLLLQRSGGWLKQRQSTTAAALEFSAYLGHTVSGDTNGDGQPELMTNEGWAGSWAVGGLE